MANNRPSRVLALVAVAVLVAATVALGATIIQSTQNPAAIEAADPTDQLERVIAGKPPIVRPEPSIFVREPLVSGGVAGLIVLVVGGLLVLVSASERR